MQAPGDNGFTDWLVGTAQTTAALPTDPGSYAFRSRPRDPATGAATGWSPVRAVTAG